MRERIFIGAVLLILLIVGMVVTGTSHKIETIFDKAQRAVKFVNSQAHVQEAARHAGIEAYIDQDDTSLTTKDLEAAAKLGNFRAQMLLSSAYLIGKKVPQNTNLSVKWYLKAIQHPDLKQSGDVNLFLRKLEIALYSKLLEEFTEEGKARIIYKENGMLNTDVRTFPEYSIFVGGAGHSLHARALYSLVYYQAPHELREQLPGDKHVFKWLEHVALKGSRAHQLILINFYKKQNNPTKRAFWEKHLREGEQTSYFDDAVGIVNRYFK